MKGTICTPINPLCKTYNTTTGNCLSCYPGYYLLNGNCFVGVNPVTDDVNCKLRDSTGKCLQCYSSYYISANATCKMANPLCKTLDFTTGDCLTCYNGYSIQSGNCVVSSANNSDPNCIKVIAGVCSECYTGFFVGGGVCTRINVLCKTSNSSNGWCLSCYPGYTLSNGQCVIPPSFTLSVQDPYCIQRSGSTCTQCSTGYFPLSGVCQIVNPLCRTVDKSGNCTSCYNGYIIQSGNCVVVQDLTIPFCQIIGNGICQKCNQGYYK
jgi:proprotein convertase subtilisin/kexin type 5